MRKILTALLLYATSMAAQLITPPPGGGAGGSGTVTSLIAGCGLSGGTITTTGTVAISIPVTAHNGAYGILTADCGDSLTTNTVATWTLPQSGSAGFPAGWISILQNVSAASALTVTTTTSNFYGSGTSGTSMTVAAGNGVIIISDGTNWQVLPLGGGSSGLVVKDNSGATIGTATSMQFLNSTGYTASLSCLAGVCTIQYALTPNAATRPFGEDFQNSGSAPTGTMLRCDAFNSSGQITSALTDTNSGTVVTATVDIRYATAAAYAASGSAGFSGYTSIVAAAPPSISAAFRAPVNTSTWTLAITAGDYYCIQATGFSGFTAANGAPPNLSVKVYYATQ